MNRDDGFWKMWSKAEIEVERSKLITEFLEDLKDFEFKRFSDMMRTLERLRKKYEAKVKE
jgi:hypothetical protein